MNIAHGYWRRWSRRRGDHETKAASKEAKKCKCSVATSWYASPSSLGVLYIGPAYGIGIHNCYRAAATMVVQAKPCIELASLSHLGIFNECV
jgi:hypothetical protein